MALRIIWSPTARKSFDNLVLFLEAKWERKVIEKLFRAKRYAYKLNIACNNPTSSKEGTR
jgi:hypothetical protein